MENFFKIESNSQTSYNYKTRIKCLLKKGKEQQQKRWFKVKNITANSKFNGCLENSTDFFRIKQNKPKGNKIIRK